MNSVTELAKQYGRDYIVPQDINTALKDNPVDVVRKDVLEVLGKQTSFGAEDRSLCAFVAWEGIYDEDL